MSGLSGRSDSFGNLPVLVDSVTSLMPSKDAELVWHRTWSYAKDYKSDLYPYYGSNQQQMDDSISAVVAKLPFPKIPSGAGVRNAREAFGDSVYRDGYHLALPLGRYIAACVWAEFITGKPVTDCSYVPEGMTPRQASIAREAAHRAIMENTFKH